MSVRGKDVFVIQPTCQLTHTPYGTADRGRCLERASAKHITAVRCSVLCYARQDRKTRGREPITRLNWSLI